jgi:hypothetical protein
VIAATRRTAVLPAISTASPRRPRRLERPAEPPGRRNGAWSRASAGPGRGGTVAPAGPRKPSERAATSVLDG